MSRRLTSAEMEVMQILWDGGELKPAEIQQRFPREIKNPALRSILGILVEKGHLVRRKEGKAFFYSAQTRQQSVFQAMMQDAADIFCQGSSSALLMSLIRAEQLSDDELLQLKRLAEADSEPPEKGTSHDSP